MVVAGEGPMCLTWGRSERGTLSYCDRCIKMSLCEVSISGRPPRASLLRSVKSRQSGDATQSCISHTAVKGNVSRATPERSSHPSVTDQLI